MGYTLLAEALNEVLVWAEEVASNRRAVMAEHHKEMRAAREKAWMPGVRGDLQEFSYCEEVIRRQEEAYQQWYTIVRASNRVLDEHEKMRRKP